MLCCLNLSIFYDRENSLIYYVLSIHLLFVCSQEVGLEYSADLSASLAAQGYAGEFCPKELGTREGEATFWREAVFTLKVQDMEKDMQEQ